MYHDFDYSNINTSCIFPLSTLICYMLPHCNLSSCQVVFAISLLQIHEGRDDLGRGISPVSQQTGNAGAPIACCVIGLSDAFNWNNPILVNGQFPNMGLNMLG